MSKYSYQLKLEIIHKHQEGYGPTYLAKTYGFKLGTIKNWLKQYQLHGEEGLQKSLSKTVYSGEFKLSVLQYRQLHQLTYAQTAKHFGIKQGATIAGWNKVYLTQGYDELCKPIGRPSKSNSLSFIKVLFTYNPFMVVFYIKFIFFTKVFQSSFSNRV
ncbi:transposase [Dolosicoccus paucivorans]|nr:transposase [Dolosicoccus paucivorans]